MIQLALMVQSNFNCKNCTRCFRDSYDLKRHMARINKCLPIKNEKNPIEKINDTEHSQPKLSGSVLAKNIDETLFENSQNTPSKCEWCLKQFVYLKQHRCKLKEDPVRTMEMEQKLNLTFPSSNKTCRFCDKEFSTTSNLKKHINTCKIKEDYVLTLQKNNFNVNNGTIINNFIVNNTINNTVNNITIVINPLGEETTDHITNVHIINCLRKLLAEARETGTGHSYDLACQLITEHSRDIRSLPENQNARVTNARDTYAQACIRTLGKPDKWLTVPTARVVQTAFKRSARDLNQRQTDISVENPLVFRGERNREIFKEIKHFSVHSVDHRGERPGAQREARATIRASLAHATIDQSV